jgi:rare lipoprotein A
MKKFIFLFLLIPVFTMAQEGTQETGKQLKGKATIYANRFQGLRTATGEIFKHSNLTAASNNFKINTWVKVTNLSNMKTVIVRINDRMHPRMAKMGRVVDLTQTAANLLGGFDGITNVKVEVIANVTGRKDSAAIID